jgi:hypothetical protein
VVLLFYNLSDGQSLAEQFYIVRNLQPSARKFKSLAMNTGEGVEIKLHAFLTPALNGVSG